MVSIAKKRESFIYPSAWGACIIVLIFLPMFLSVDESYLIYFLFMLFTYTTIAACWNIVAGFAGQLSLGSQAFFGIGAYTAALSWKWGWTGFFSLQGIVASGFIAVILAILIGVPLLSRLRGDYFALGTLGLGEILRVLFINGKSLTGGAIGVMMPSKLYPGMIPYYYSCLILVTITLVAIRLIVNSRIGLAMISVREDEQAASTNGIKVLRTKLFAFAFGAFFIGIAGSLQAYYLFHIHPYGVFSLNWGLMPILMTLVGGIGTFLGPVIGSVILVTLFELANTWLPEIHPIFSGLMIILVTLFMPNGILALLRKNKSEIVLFGSLRERFFGNIKERRS